MSDLKNNKNYEATSEKPVLCVSCHEFFGSKSTDDLCSKCYRITTKVSEEKVEEKVAAFDKAETKVQFEEEKTQEPAPSQTNDIKEVKEEGNTSKQKDITRCFGCSKKVGLLGFKCQCEMVFCRTHRQPEAHSCTFDFCKVAKERLARENVVVKADKLQRF